jgi:DNA-binding transcriptional LysR family regulator
MAATTTRETARLLSRLRFRHLQLIVELGRERSLRSAASAFAVTQPALSRTLGEIETAFGFPLFRRSARGVEPTPEGEVAIRGAAVLLQEIEHLRVEAAQVQHTRALVRLGATPFIAHGYLPSVVATLAAKDPPVRVQLVEGGAPALIDALLQGQLDAVVSTLKGTRARGWEPRLRYETLFTAEFTVIARVKHPLAVRRRVNWADLVHERWILPPKPSGLYEMIEERFVSAGTRMPLPVAEVASPVTAVRMAAAGAGLALVPALTLEYMRHGADVCRVHAWPTVPPDNSGLISRAGGDNARVALLRDALRDRVRSRA